MTDMLVRLYALDAIRRTRATAAGVTVRRALAAERRPVVTWVAERFGAGWAGECETGFCGTPTRCLLALSGGAIAGFALWDVTARGYFGPTGVDPASRQAGIGAALLLATLSAMREAGYGYAIIGGAGAPDFFARVAGAMAIPDSTPGVYAGMVKVSAG